MNLVDLSCHVLDGTGCGPESYAESLEMCRAAAAEGVSIMVATPRWAPGSLEPPLTFDECRRKVERLQGELNGEVVIKLGFLLPFSSKLLDLVDRYGHEIALGGKHHLLISLSSLQALDGAERVWGALVSRGFTPVIAQPECSPLLRRNLERVAGWVEKGVKLQVSASSVVGAYGREVRNSALALLGTYGESVFVASNARGTRDKVRMLSSVHEDLRTRLGVQRANRFLWDAPTAIVADVEAAPSRDSSKRVGRLPTILDALKLSKALKRAS